jgi:hypothetical protein
MLDPREKRCVRFIGGAVQGPLGALAMFVIIVIGAAAAAAAAYAIALLISPGRTSRD